jgi:hypothetical protein
MPCGRTHIGTTALAFERIARQGVLNTARTRDEAEGGRGIMESLTTSTGRASWEERFGHAGPDGASRANAASDNAVRACAARPAPRWTAR